MENPTQHNPEDKQRLQEKLDLFNSYLDDILSSPLTKGYNVTRTSDYINALTYFEENMDAIEKELEEFDDDKYLDEFFNS